MAKRKKERTLEEQVLMFAVKTVSSVTVLLIAGLMTDMSKLFI